MDNKPLVSMITYCYNGERFVSNYFEAILSQTYTNIELIFFDNGSEDKTLQIAESYREKLTQKGIIVNIIHYDENQSTCMLKQRAFQEMKGEYFFGCDSDDYIDPTYVEEMVTYLLENPEKGIVYCQLRMVEEETGIIKSIMKMQPRYKSKEAFVDILMSRNINYTAISYMMSTKHLDKINPDRTIHISRYGENYQVQMPFLYHDLQGYIEKPLGQYTVRKDSYSGTLDYNKKVIALKGQEESVLATFGQLDMPDRDYFEKLYLARNRRDRFMVSLYCDNLEIVKECLKELKDINAVSFRVRIYYCLYKLNLLKFINKIKKRR